LQNDSKLGYKSAIDWSNGHLGHAWWAAKISNILINNGPTGWPIAHSDVAYLSGPPGIHYQSGWPVVYLNVSYLSGPPGIHHISGWPIVHLNVSYLSDPPIRSIHCALKYCLFERPTFQVGPLFIKMLLILAAHQA
jgi:hypothetical protein